jgi:cytoskeletal protein CcmA (bactofilin family)
MNNAGPLKITSKIDTTLAEDIIFKGLLKFKDSLQINGIFEGKIETSGHLIIAEKASVRADIETQTISVAGKLDGNIQKAEKVHFASTSEINGDIFSRDLIIEAGARFNGVCVMNK